MRRRRRPNEVEAVLGLCRLRSGGRILRVIGCLGRLL